MRTSIVSSSSSKEALLRKKLAVAQERLAHAIRKGDGTRIVKRQHVVLSLVASLGTIQAEQAATASHVSSRVRPKVKYHFHPMYGIRPANARPPFDPLGPEAHQESSSLTLEDMRKLLRQQRRHLKARSAEVEALPVTTVDPGEDIEDEAAAEEADALLDEATEIEETSERRRREGRRGGLQDRTGGGVPTPLIIGGVGLVVVGLFFAFRR